MSFLLCTIVGLSANTSAKADNRIIKGKILAGDDGLPLIGASVYVHQDDLKKANIRQANLGSVTDLDGNFTIAIPEKITRIYCSFIGYEETSVELKQKKDYYEIVLDPDSQRLDNVIVTGYQTLEKRKLTASVSKVYVNDAMVGPVKSIDQALTGQIAGVSVTNASGAPGSPAKIRIRGTASLNGTQDPLWVLDGIPLEGTDVPNLQGADIVNMKESSIAGISPSDIDDITILKDAAATAIYGARAANGVIVITTKKGKAGKSKVNFSTKLTYSPNLSVSRLNLLNSNQKVDLEMQLLQAPAKNVWGDLIPSFLQKGGVADILRPGNKFDAFRENGLEALSPEEIASIEALRGINTNWSDILFRDSFTHEYNLSISGGNDHVTYYNSIGYSQENGNVPGVSLDRFNLTSKVNYKLNNFLKVGASVFANRRKNKSFVTDRNGYSNPLFYARTANPYFAPYNAEGGYNYDFNISTNDKPDPEQKFNIFEERNNTKNVRTTTSINSIFDVQLKFSKHFKLNSQIGLQWDQSDTEKYIGFETFSTRVARQNSIYREDGEIKYIIPEGGMLKKSNSTTTQLTWKTMGEYSQKFNDIHDVQIMAGSEIRKNWLKSSYSNAYGYNPKTLTTKPLYFRDDKDAKNYPLFGQSDITNAFSAFFANGSYTLKDKYTLGASIRFDGSDLFGVDKKYRYLPIYSFSGLWRLSDEPWMRGADWLDNLALRASYGLQGNIDKQTSPHLIGSYDNVSVLPGTSEENITIDGAPNEKLRWEKTASYNFGFDFAVLNQAINMSLDYYYRKGTDLIGSKRLPLESGFMFMNVNWASMENSGVEFNITSRNISTKNFSWYTNFNFAYNKNKVLKETISSTQKTPSREGYPVGAIFEIDSKVNPENGRIMIKPNGADEYSSVEELFNMVDEWGIGLYSYDNENIDKFRSLYTYKGTSDAPYTGGIMNTFTYKNWELNINMSYHLGAYVRTTPSYDIYRLDPGHNVNSDILNRWTPTNTDTSFPALLTKENLPADDYFFSENIPVYNNLDMWVKKLSYLRLQNIRLAYRLPSNFTHKLRIESATIGLEARNLFVIGTSYKNYLDPESMGNPYAAPMPKSWTFNLNINF